MSNNSVLIKCLMIDDEQDFIDLFKESLPSFEGYELDWTFCNSFEDALSELSHSHYGLLVTDIYNGHVNQDDAQGSFILKKVRSKSFLPVVLTSSGSLPGDINMSCFVRFADKSMDQSALEKEIKFILDSGIPYIRRRLHDEIDRDASGFLWDFLDSKWDEIQDTPLKDKDNLYVFIKRRAAQALGRLNEGIASERDIVNNVDFYIYPPISGNVLRMGQIIRDERTNEYYIVLTPHCLLENQPGRGVRADFITVAPLRSADDVSAKNEIKQEDIEKWIAHPNTKGSPSGRYFFCPRFLDMNDKFADLLAPTSIEGSWPIPHFTRHACLDTPFAEALQSQYVKLFSTVGLPRLTAQDFEQLAYFRTEVINVMEHCLKLKPCLSTADTLTITGVPKNISREQLIDYVKSVCDKITSKTVGWRAISDMKGTHSDQLSRK